MRLSLCIATYNRGRFIGETLDSIVAQLRDGVEVVIVDGASPDNTPEILAEYARKVPAVRYFREAENSGVDRDYDKAVGYAAGEHCWLLTDDDTLAPAAIDRALLALEGGSIDLLVVDAEIRDASLTRTLRAGRLGFTGERTYGPAERDAFLRDAGYVLSFIGGVIMRRSYWLGRAREPYFGSLFVHVGVIFQAPTVERMKVLGESLVRIRLGNAMWKPRSFEIWAFKWPKLIWSFDTFGCAAKQGVTPREPWRGLRWLMGYRALGAYSFDEYRRLFSSRKVGLVRPILFLSAVFPGRLANLIAVCVLALSEKGGTNLLYDMVASSRFSNGASRQIARVRIGDLADQSARRWA